jgi:hypothetical protein
MSALGFWYCVLRPEKPFVVEPARGRALRVKQAVLVPPSDDAVRARSRVTVSVGDKKKEVTIAALSTRAPCFATDLVFLGGTALHFCVRGDCEVHLAGCVVAESAGGEAAPRGEEAGEERLQLADAEPAPDSFRVELAASSEADKTGRASAPKAKRARPG